MSPTDSDRIEALTETVGDMCVLVKVSLAEARADRARMDKLEKRVDGPADEPEKGIVVKLDRVSEAQRRQSKFIWVLIGATVAQAVNMFIG